MKGEANFPALLNVIVEEQSDSGFPTSPLQVTMEMVMESAHVHIRVPHALAKPPQSVNFISPYLLPQSSLVQGALTGFVTER